MQTAFYMAGSVAVVSAAMAISRRQPMHALLYLLVMLLATAVVLLLLGAQFAAALEVVLYAASSAVNTDFTGKLLDVYPDGKAIYLRDGIIRASFRGGPRNPSNIEPGKAYEYRIDLWATSHVFLRGHRLRLDISSSNFPRFDRNLNTGGSIADDARPLPAVQTVYHDRQHPSHLLLPVVP